VLDTLYTDAEQAKMQAYRDAIDRTTYKPPNASGSSYGMQQKPKDSLMADMVKDAGMHVLSGGNAVVSAMRSLGGLAQRFTTTEAERLGSEGAAAAKRAVNQDIPGRQPYPYGRYGIAPTTQAIMRALGK
jgi:hypothetical protein